jgi:hypothetical protein
LKRSELFSILKNISANAHFQIHQFISGNTLKFSTTDFVFWLHFQYQHIDEEEKLRKELKDTLMMYDRACGNLAHAKKKVSHA